MNGAEGASPTPTESPTVSSNKRRSEDGQPQQRAKRARYISVACNECKRRKIKCNGQTPCQRCGNLALECVYAPNCCSNLKDTEEFKQMMGHISALQQQVDMLYSDLSALRGHVDSSTVNVDTSAFSQPPFSQSPVSTAVAPMPRSVQNPRHPRFHGPTSSAFSLGVAKSSLQTMGITETDDALGEGIATQDGTPTASPTPVQPGLSKPLPVHASKDPIWSVDRDEAIRLIHVWQDEMGCMYPVVEVQNMLRHTNLLFTFMDAARRTGLMAAGLPGADAIYDDQTRMLKLVLAVALTLEGSGKSDLGKRLFETSRQSLEDQVFAPADLRAVRMLCLAAMYHFHRDEESVAWRSIGLAARFCVEIGLHRRETYKTIFSTEDERASATLLFWSVRVLDQRWSFGTGLPFAMQDADIDPLLQKPGNATPYLAAMTMYSSIGSRVWQRVATFEATRTELSSEEIEYLDYQVIQWHRSIPDSLKYIPAGQTEGDQPSSRSNHRLRILLYLRGNQMRINIFRPILHSTSSILESLSHAHTAVGIAKDTIRILTVMNQTTDLYRTQQVMFNYFLISALAVLFLAVSHAPEQFSNCCRDEFYMALDLVRSMTPNSYVSKRLWRTIKGLKEIGPKLGLNMRNPVDAAADAHSTAAVAMAGLAGHNVDELAIFGNGNPSIGFGHGDSPNGMANDLTSLFEAVGSNGYSMSGASGLPTPNGGYAAVGAAPDATGSEELGSIFGHQDELSRILRDLF